MNLESHWHLKNFNIFKAMSEPEVMRLQDMITTDWIKKKDPVYLQGEKVRWVYFLKKGLVKLSMPSSQGKAITVALLKPGEIFGELTSSDDPEASTEAIALKDSYLCRMSHERFFEFARNNSEMFFRINKLLGLRMKKVEIAIHDMLFLDVPARLSKLLLQLLETDSEDSPEGKRITLPLTHQEIANLVGATREMVTMVLGKMTDEGVIIQVKRRIIVTDPARLASLYRPPA